jgi:acetyltransferase-like isoleucine patch superfamily enzyme
MSDTLKDQNLADSAPLPRTSARRIIPAIVRRLRRVYLGLRHRRADFEPGCDIRSGLSLEIWLDGKVTVGRGCVLDRGMSIECRGTLTIGAGTIAGHHCTIGVVDRVEIGENCLIAEMVSIRDHDHRFENPDVPIRRQGFVSAPVIIGKNVWLGAKVTVLKGVRIGDNCIIGANAVVTKDIPANAVAVGVPAKVVRIRTHE